MESSASSAHSGTRKTPRMPTTPPQPKPSAIEQGSTSSLEVHPAWWPDADLTLAAARACFRYGPGEDRATGYLYGDGQRWPPELATVGERLLEALGDRLGVQYTHVA